MLIILFRSSAWAWAGQIITTGTKEQRPFESRDQSSPSDGSATSLLRRLALPQAALAILALSNYHVQIITRLASGYPLWYWWLAWGVIQQYGQDHINHESVKGSPKLIARWMVMYALVQAGLFASFLPPA